METVAIVSLIVGAIALALSVYFFDQNNKLYNHAQSVLSRIETSSTAAEVRSKEVLEPTVRALLEGVRVDARSNTLGLVLEKLQLLQAQLAHLVAGFTEEASKASNEGERNIAYQKLLDEFSAHFQMLRDRLDAAFPETRTVMKAAPVPGSTSYNWCPFLRRMRDLEQHHNFLSVKWLRETKFAKDPESQEALEIAIAGSVLSTYHRPNPRNPLYPTLCCRLNREHPIVAKCLEAPAQGPPA